jgi:hypothetical protein
LRRFLLHLLPEGFVRIRNFGFLANRKRATALPLCFQLLGATPHAKQEISTASPSDLWTCPKCGGAMVLIEGFTAAEIQLRSPPAPDAVAAWHHDLHHELSRASARYLSYPYSSWNAETNLAQFLQRLFLGLFAEHEEQIWAFRSVKDNRHTIGFRGEVFDVAQYGFSGSILNLDELKFEFFVLIFFALFRFSLAFVNQLLDDWPDRQIGRSEITCVASY